MRKEELSHGNWVYIDGEPAKVKSISYLEIGDNPISLVVEYRNGRSDLPSELTNKIEPIPLTPEIFEKNGFDIQDNGIYLNIKSDFYEIDAKEVSDGYWRIRVTSCEIINEQDEIHTSYVHSLQNFLTLCGVELEIKL